MRRSFGEYLYEFSESVDNISKEVFENVMGALGTYLTKSFYLASVGFLIETKVNNRPGLSVEWRQEGAGWANSLFNTNIDFADLGVSGIPKDNYNGQVSFAFVQGKPLWIVPEEEDKYLNDTEAYRELWSNIPSTSIPTFVHNHDKPVKTAIVIPLFRKAPVLKAHPLGILNLESEKYLEPTEDSKQELEKISEAISILYDLKTVQALQQRGTKDVLKKIIDESQKQFVIEPRVFIASANSRESDAFDLIEKAVKEVFTDAGLRPPIINDWKKSDSPTSNIPKHIWNEMRSSHVGICYFSEPCQSTQECSSAQFKDNPNVLFEAGLMDALEKLSNSIPDSRFNGWVLVREQDSPEIMLDLTVFHRVDINRENDEISNSDEVQQKIKDFVKKLFFMNEH